MELARINTLEITAASQRVVRAATEYARRRGSRNVQTCHFRLEKEMQRISVAAGGILGVLSKASLPNGPPLNDRLEEWFSTDELPTCLETLLQMERMLGNDTWIGAITNFVNTLGSVPQEDRIDEAVKLFDSRRNYFHFLLTTDVWDCEDFQRQQPALPVHAQDGTITQSAQFNAAGVCWNVNFPPHNTPNRTGVEAHDTRPIDIREKVGDILKWLNAVSCVIKQEETLSLKQPDTCMWLHSTPEYEAWRNCDDSFLWLQGKPGSGKTILASFVIDSLQNQWCNGEPLAFFYCDFRNDRSTSATEVMRSLLSQLLRQIRDDENIDPGELIEDIVREKDGDTPVLETIKHLLIYASRTAKLFSHQPVVVVDALDECKDIEKLINGLLTLAKGGIRLFVTSRPLQVIKDAFYGLPSLSMGKMMSSVSMDIALHVTRELDSRRRLRNLEYGFKMEIHAILCDRADGMFRWVQCQIDTLNRCTTRAEVREALDNLPIGLDETYQRILTAIDVKSPEGGLALRALVWLIGALRPLRSLEILEGLMVDLGRRTMDCDIGPMHRGALLDACGSLVAYNEETDILILSHFSVKEYLTSDLTRTNLPQYHISYKGAHEHLARICICYTALYLKHVHACNESTSQLRILQTVNGKTRSTARVWPCSSGDSSDGFSVSQQLLGYVFAEGFNHLLHLGPANHIVLTDMTSLQLDVQRYPEAWETVHQMTRHDKSAIPWPSPEHDFILYVLMAWSPASLFLAYLRRTGSRSVLMPKCRTNPLVYAAHFGKAEHAEMLLLRGANVNERGLAIDASRQVLPLEVAVKRRHEVVVDLFLSAGSTVPKHLFTLSTYYYKYPIRIVRKLLETDQFMEWALEPGNKLPSPLRILERQLPLIYETDIIVVIRRLVQVGVGLTEHDSAGRTALHFAILGGYQATMVYLLLLGSPLTTSDFASIASASYRIPMLRLLSDAVINVNAHVGADGDTILHLAIRFIEDHCLEATQILIGAGCKPFVRNAADKTPLHIALEGSNTSVADYLMLQGNPPSDILLAVVESKCPTAWRLQTVRALVARGADILGITLHEDALLRRGMTSLENREGLEMAKCGDRRDTSGVEIPLDLMEDDSPLLADYLCSTERPPPFDALFALLRSDLSNTWKCLAIYSLVSKGADIHGPSGDGSTLLHATVHYLDERQGLDVTRLLITAGCDPFQCNADRQTPFHIALDLSLPLIADCLLSTGNSLPPDALFAVLASALPEKWRAQTICSLVEKGADVYGLSGDGNTLLHATVLSLNGHQALDVAKNFVSAGCNPSIRNAEGKTVLHTAAETVSVPVLEYLLELGMSLPDDILFAALKLKPLYPEQLRMLRILVDKGANVHTITGDGSNPLHVAISSSRLHSPSEVVRLNTAVEILVKGGCNALAPDACGRTPLHLVVKKHCIPVVKYLLQAAVPSHLPLDILFCTLHGPDIAATYDTIKLLVEKGANVRILEDDGSNVIHAVLKEFRWSRRNSILLDTVKLFVDSGCDPSHRDASGHAPVYFAVMNGQYEVVEYLSSPKNCPSASEPKSGRTRAAWRQA